MMANEKMNATLGDIKTKYVEPAKAWWSEQEPKRRVLMIVAAVLLLVALMGTVAYLNYSPYTVLVSEMESAEMAEVLAILEENAVPSKVEGTGTILVPQKQEAAIRMKLAVAGYPKSGLGYDLFTENIGSMSTDSDRKAYQLFQLQERLAKSIETISGVKHAIVTINLDDGNSYVWNSNQKNSSAGVLITMSSGNTLTQEQVNGVKRLVATSVKGMDAANVSVIDAGTGEELEANADSVLNKANDKLEIERIIDKTVEEKIKNILVPVLGAENVYVVATSRVNTNTGIKQETIYTPSNDNNTGVTYKEEHYLEGSNGNILAAGIPGAETNADLATYPIVDEEGGNGQYINNWNYDYYVNETREETNKQDIVIENINVGITVNRSDMTQAEKDDLIELVAATANIPEENVVIYAADFYGSDVAEPTGWQAYLVEYWPFVLAGVLLLIVLVVLLIMLLIRKRRNAAEEDIWDEQQPLEAISGDVEIEALEVHDSKQSVMVKQLQQFTDEHPEIVGQLIHNWLKGDDEY